MTLGEYRVGVTFNPSGDAGVHAIKRAAADLIDLISRVRDEKIEGLKADEQMGEILRCSAVAMTAIEEATMWAVKAATKGPMS